ncbi:MAG: hypothetical protein ACNA8W_01755 [Bradymonadaceae bacterium]
MKPYSNDFYARLVAMLAAALLTSLAFSATVWAQDDEEPLRLVHINTAGETGTHSFNALQGILKQSNQIVLIPQTTFMAGASRYGLEMSTFRRGAEREANAGVFKKLLAELDIEGLVIQDVFGRGGSTLQLVVIGPRGHELADIRRDARRGRVSNDDAMAMLREVFATLVPDVRGYRSEQEEIQRREAEAQRERELQSQRQSDQDLDLREQAIADHRERHGNLETGYNISAGAMIGQRLMRLASEDTSPFNHNTPFVGIAGHAEGIFSVFDNDAGAFGAGLFGGYAPFQTEFLEDLLPSTYARLGLDLFYLRALTSDFILRVYGGVEATSVTLTANDLYTGHRYILGRVGLGVNYLFGDFGALEINGGVLPILDADNSSGGFGEIETALGYGGSARLKINIGESMNVGLDYTFQLHSLTYPDPPNRTEPANSRDMFHIGMISMGYRL